MRTRTLIIGLVVVAAILALATRGADAAFKGENGRIAFQLKVAGNNDIYTMPSKGYTWGAPGADLLRLTTNPAVDADPAWSPPVSAKPGVPQRIAFRSERDGNSEIYVMRTDGSSQQRLTEHGARDEEPAWSPDGMQIVFTSWRDGNPEIYVMNADGSNERRLTTSLWWDGAPAWSPDGKRIAFHSDRGGNFDIYVMNAADGSGVTPLTESPASDLYPDWSPADKKSRIAFQSDRDGNIEIYVMYADGSGEKRLTVDPAIDRTPAFSPDGQQIVFAANRPDPGGFNFELYSRRLDSAVVARLSTSDGLDDFPNWQPVSAGPPSLP